MNIGIDARNLVSELSGIGRYVIESTRSLIALGHQVTLYLPSEPRDLGSVPKNADLQISNFGGSVKRIMWGNTVLPGMIAKANHDVFWAPAHRLPWRPITTPCVLTVHDLVWHYAGETMTKRGWMAERLFFRRALQNADRIVAVSHATKMGISNVFPWATNKIDVVYPGCTKLKVAGSREIFERMKIDQPFALFVGTLEPRKNLVQLLRAFALVVGSMQQRLLLVIAGRQGWGEANLKQEIAQLGIEENVRLTGHVTDEELACLYKGARFLTFPSLYEGFGFPIIEANAAGIPVITSNNSSMPEVAGKAAIFVNANDVSSIAQGIIRLATDNELHSELSKAAVHNAARFDWDINTINLAEALTRAIEAHAA